MDGSRKKHCKDVETVEQEVESIDWISELPETVMHHIFSFIRCPKEAARTSILSKTWRDAWKSFAILRFDEESFMRTDVHICSNERTQKFVDFIDNSLLTYTVQNSLIYKLVLRINPTLIMYVNRWIRMATAQSLSELVIIVETNPLFLMTSCFNYLPLSSRSASTLTALRLQGMNWSNFQALKFSNLQELCLERLHIYQQIIQELVSISPLIMELIIVGCHGFQDLTISGFRNLERVALRSCYGLTRIELQVPSLQTFWYCSNEYSPSKLNMESCISLENLKLEDRFMTPSVLYDLLLSFPDLKKLDISCREFLSITIPNNKLRHLTLRNCNNLCVDTDPANPCSFYYEGSKMAHWWGPLCVREAKFSVSTKEDDVNGIPSRNKAFFDFLKHRPQGFKVIFLFYKNIIIHDESKNTFLPSFLDVKFHIISMDAKGLLNSLLTTWHPERIVVASSPSSDVPKTLRGIKSCEQPSCCSTAVQTDAGAIF